MSTLATHLSIKEPILWSGRPVQGLQLRLAHWLFGPFGLAWAASQAVRRARTEYLVTEDRVLIGDLRGDRIDLRVIPFVSMPDPVLHLRAGGGTIVFIQDNRTQEEPMPPPRFELGGEARHVFDIVTHAQARAVARWPIAPPPRSH